MLLSNRLLRNILHDKGSFSIRHNLRSTGSRLRLRGASECSDPRIGLDLRWAEWSAIPDYRVPFGRKAIAQSYAEAGHKTQAILGMASERGICTWIMVIWKSNVIIMQ